MADIVSFPPPGPPASPPASPEYEALRERWRLARHSVEIINAILAGTNVPGDMPPEQRWQLQWQLEYLIKMEIASMSVTVSVDAFKDVRLPDDEYQRLRERYMRSIGLGHLL